jgi:hypothetical protein
MRAKIWKVFNAIYWVVMLSLFVTLLLSITSVISIEWFLINLGVLVVLYMLQSLFFEDYAPPEN